MAEYIEREELLAALKPDEPGDDRASVLLSDVRKLLRKFAAMIPAADVAPVVRCRDCVRCEEERTAMGHVLFCYHWVRNTTEDGYCHEGVAMEGR